MSYKRISLRFNMEDADERRAWELLHNGDIAVINTEIIKRINDAERYKHLEWILRKVVSEELKALPLTLSIETENKILTQNVAIGLDGRKHRRNLNVLVCGGSGAGKTRFFAKPNIMNANTSFVVLDPNGKEVLGYILQAVH